MAPEADAVQTHDSEEECTAAEEYLPGSGSETTVKTETRSHQHEEVVECPVCGRRYKYVFEAEGFFDEERREYVSAEEHFDPQFDADGESAGQTYNVPVKTNDGREINYVFVLDFVTAVDGEYLHSF